MTPEEIVSGLCPLEREWLLGWEGPAGAAYNVIAEGFCEQGLIDKYWQLRPLGIAVKALLTSDAPNPSGRGAQP